MAEHPATWITIRLGPDGDDADRINVIIDTGVPAGRDALEFVRDGVRGAGAQALAVSAEEFTAQYDALTAAALASCKFRQARETEERTLPRAKATLRCGARFAGAPCVALSISTAAPYTFDLLGRLDLFFSDCHPPEFGVGPLAFKDLGAALVQALRCARRARPLGVDGVARPRAWRYWMPQAQEAARNRARWWS